MQQPTRERIDHAQQQRTFRLELLRSVPQGYVESAAATFAVYVAIRVFDLAPWIKSAILGSGSVGLLLSLFVVQMTRRFGWAVNHVMGIFWAGSSVGFAVAAVAGDSGAAYAMGTCFALVCLASASPLMAQIYRDHYADEKRGRLFSLSSLSRACIAAISGWLVGVWLERSGIRPLFFSYAAACLVMAASVWSMAPVRLRSAARISWFDAFSHVRENRAFAKLLVMWMLLGLGNLVAWALFVEYVSNPEYGFGFDAGRSGLVTGTVPMLAYILTVVAWGGVFDRQPFYRVRALVNAFFIVGTLVYYMGGTLWMLCAGMAIHGIARSGGQIIWMLWTTRFSDRERQSEYQSVHSFLTGMRGVMAPFLAYACLRYMGPMAVALLSAALMLLATLLIVPDMVREGSASHRGSG